MGVVGDKTQKGLEMALKRILAGRPKVVERDCRLSISAVAQEAGVSPSTIHNRYPEIAERIRAASNNDTRTKNTKKTQALKTEREKNRQLRKEIELVQQQNQQLLSINARLMAENEQMNTILQSNKVAVLHPNRIRKN